MSSKQILLPEKEKKEIDIYIVIKQKFKPLSLSSNQLIIIQFSRDYDCSN